jgi:hypothetical protein
MNRTKRPVKGQSVPRRNRALGARHQFARHGTVDMTVDGRGARGRAGRGAAAGGEENSGGAARTECPLPNARGEGGEPEALIVRSFVIDETHTCDEPSGRYFEYFNGRFVLARERRTVGAWAAGHHGPQSAEPRMLLAVSIGRTPPPRASTRAF